MKSTLSRIITDFHSLAFPAFRNRALQVPLDLEKIITIIGPRRAGKTYYLYQLMTELERRGIHRKRIVYLNFEDERLVFEESYDIIFDVYRELYPKHELADTYFFFDEIQELNDWEKFIRRMYDRISSHIFLTGSNGKLLSREIATSLRGRCLSFEILPLSFSEYCEFNDVVGRVAHSSHDIAKINRLFEQYCQWGGFPELITIDERFKPAILQEYFNVMLYRDLIERYGMREVSLLKYVIKRLISSYTKEFSINKIYNELKSRNFSVGKDLLYQMVEQIFSIYMVASVEKFDPSVIRREMSNKKIYLYDIGFAAATPLFFSPDRGKRLENLVFSHFRTQTEDIYFARNGWECDFIVFLSKDNPLYVQVTERLDHNSVDREIKGLLGIRKRLGKGESLILFETRDKGLQIPEKIAIQKVRDFLLTREQ